MDNHFSIKFSDEWQKLDQHAQEIFHVSLSDLKKNTANRFDLYSLNAAGIILDFSNNHLNSKTMQLLFRLAERVNLSAAIDHLFNGEVVNSSEGCAALHTALRDLDAYFQIDKRFASEIQVVRTKMLQFVDAIRQGEYRGYQQESIQHVVNIGIGGSDLGPKMVYQALQAYQDIRLDFHFVSNLDEAGICKVLKQCNPGRTLFIVSSKSFTTLETLSNLAIARKWMQTAAGNVEVNQHFIAVTAAPLKAAQHGFLPKFTLPFWDWVGGRYSIWSAVGLSLAIAIGRENFLNFLAGAHAMDVHFKTAPFSENLPVVLGLIGVWYNNFFRYQSRAIIPYYQGLSLLPNYLQQLSMESLGKCVTADGYPVDYATGEVVWGGVGTNSQHSFHQLLLQGTHAIATDFVLPITLKEKNEAHLGMIANCLAQSRIFTEGFSSTKHVERVIAGNRPHNLILLEKMTPYSLGALIALYEHKVYVQSILWRINAFDQWGMQRSKEVAKEVFDELRVCQKELNAPSLMNKIAENIYG